MERSVPRGRFSQTENDNRKITHRNDLATINK